MRLSMQGGTWMPENSLQAMPRDCQMITQQSAHSVLQALHAVERHLPIWAQLGKADSYPENCVQQPMHRPLSGAAHQLELVLLLIPLSLGIRQHGPCMVSSPLLGRQRGQCVQRRGRCRPPDTASHTASHSTARDRAARHACGPQISRQPGTLRLSL